MKERSAIIEWLRGELVGPSRSVTPPSIIEFNDGRFTDPVALRSGPLAWCPAPNVEAEEILYFQRETPHRKYGAGLLHPGGQAQPVNPDQAAAEASDTLGIEPEGDEPDASQADDDESSVDTGYDGDIADASDDFEVTSSDIRHPSTMGISFCLRLEPHGRIIVRLPTAKHFRWQNEGGPAFPLNGRYESCARSWTDEAGSPKDAPVWRRRPALLPETAIEIERDELLPQQVIRRNVPMPESSPITLRIEVFPRCIKQDGDLWLLTVVLRNSTQQVQVERQSILYQTYFEVAIEGGRLEKYPESQRPFDQLDDDEQSLALLYRESATWGIGHGCAAGWDADPGESPTILYSDVMPAVETPSMTPAIKDAEGNPIQLAMRALSELSDDGQGAAWESLDKIANEYERWIGLRLAEANVLPEHLRVVANRHLKSAATCLSRIKMGIDMLRGDLRARTSFRLANLAMLLQQIAAKQLKKRSLYYDTTDGIVRPEGRYTSPWNIFDLKVEEKGLGVWRAFQIAFLLMSICGVLRDDSDDRDVVDLIWFPTGGGKTEAYLGVLAFYMFHQRLLIEEDSGTPRRDGTNALMRYTLRMLTTQQFQRAASLICAMEFLRREQATHKKGHVPGNRFSLGLWIGSGGSPNTVTQAKTELGLFRSGGISGNPLVLTECPWCRAEIGRYDGPKPAKLQDKEWKARRVRGIVDHPTEGPLLLCPDANCVFGREDWHDWLPVEVIDQRIYNNPPSMVIGTADKFAIIAFRPAAGSLFGRNEIARIVVES